MEPEERNRVMDRVLPWVDRSPHGERAQAIRECDRLARAWDALKKKTQEMQAIYQKTDFTLWNRGHEAAFNTTLLQMEALLSPAPKDPLEKLEEFIVEGCGYQPTTCEILEEIRRLRAEGKK